MKVLLLAPDSIISNLALMRISAYHKARGDDVGFDVENPDYVYISVAFTKSRKKAQRLLKRWPNAYVGGPGWDIHSNLPPKIEMFAPDLTLYDRDYAVGRTSVGCIRRCPWCIEWRVAPKVKKKTSIQEILQGRKKVMLLDANPLALPDYIKTLMYLRDRRIKINWVQGLDIRLVTPAVACVLAGIQSYGQYFKTPRHYFAFDDIRYEKQIRRGIEILLQSLPAGKASFFILGGYGNPDNFDDVKRRASIIESYGCHAYITTYAGASRRVRTLGRWVNLSKGRAADYRHQSKEGK